MFLLECGLKVDGDTGVAKTTTTTGKNEKDSETLYFDKAAFRLPRLIDLLKWVLLLA
jgi:hypothetical protein